jgi:hypothetical protein
MTSWSLSLGSGPSAMARRRDGSQRRPLWIAAALVLVFALLGGAIQLGNSAASLRRGIQDLGREVEIASARQALLELQWNRASSRQVVMRRAARELGLISPEAPGLVLLAVSPDQPSEEPWTRWRRHLAQDGPVPAALAGAVTP